MLITKHIKILLFVFISFIFCIDVYAANHYIRDGASGDGSDWANAWDDLPSSLVRGDTYYVADGNYSSYTFDDAVSGTSVITVKKASASEHGTETGWSSTYGDGTAYFGATINFRTSYITFDGSYRDSGWTSGYGFKVSYSGSTIGVKLIACYSGYTAQHITVKYVEAEHAGDLGSGTADGWDAFYLHGTTSDWYIGYNYIHNVGRVPIYFVGTTDSIAEYNYIADNWSQSIDHAEAIQTGTSSTTDLVIRYNYFHNTDGTGVIVLNNADRAQVYGNVMYECDSNDGAVVPTCPDHGSDDVEVYNNTLVDGTGWSQRIGGCSGDSGWIVRNNLWYGNAQTVSLYNCTHDYNAADDDLSETHDQLITSAIFSNYAGGDLTLSTGTDDGYDLLSPYNTDLLGNIRGADAVWDRGAYEYTGTDVTAPVMITIAVDAEGDDLDITFDETIAENYTNECTLDCSYSGSSIALTNITGSGTAWSMDIGTTLEDGETCTMDCTFSSNEICDTEVSPNCMTSFADAAVTNNTDTLTPTMLTAQISPSGTFMAMAFNEPIYGSGSGFTISGLTGGSVIATYLSGSGTYTLTFTLSRLVYGSEGNGLLAYTPGTWVDSVSNALGAFSGTTLVNASTASEGGVAGKLRIGTSTIIKLSGGSVLSF